MREGDNHPAGHHGQLESALGRLAEVWSVPWVPIAETRMAKNMVAPARRL
jgi:hypothetical protein